MLTAVQGALSMLAESATRVLDLFPVKAHNAAGVYAVRLHWRGEWVTVVVDDFFPYRADIEVSSACLPHRKPPFSSLAALRASRDNPGINAPWRAGRRRRLRTAPASGSCG